MLTNDKSNIVSKAWRHFQDYLSSVGNAYNNLNRIRFAIENMLMHPSKIMRIINIDLFKTMNALIDSIDESLANPII